MTSITLDDIKSILDYVSEAIVISNQDGLILYYNDAAIKKLHLPNDKFEDKVLTDFIPDDEIWKLKEALKRGTNDYYEIILQRQTGEMFPALVSGQYITLDDHQYRISTILDMTELKDKEKELLYKSQEQISKLKSHVIAKVSSFNQEKNKLRDELISEIHELQDEVKQNNILLDAMKKQVMKLKSKNEQLTTDIQKLEQNHLNFEDLLNIEIVKANKHKTNLAFMMIAIKNYDELLHIFDSVSKMDILISAVIRSFKQIIGKTDLIEYTDKGLFHIIFNDYRKNELEERIQHLIQEKNLANYSISFKYGIAYLFEKDNAQRMMHRCAKEFYEI